MLELSSVLCNDLEVWFGGDGCGREAQKRGDICIHMLIYTIVQLKLAQHCKAIFLQFLKFLQIKTKIKQRKGRDWEEGEWLDCVVREGLSEKRDFAQELEKVQK